MMEKFKPADPFASAEPAVDLSKFTPKKPADAAPRISAEEAARAGEAAGFVSREAKKAEPAKNPFKKPAETRQPRSFSLYSSEADIIEKAITQYAEETKCSLRSLPSDSDIVRAALHAFDDLKPGTKAQLIRMRRK